MPPPKSQKVIWGRLLGRHAASLLWGCLEYLEVLVQMLVELQDGSHIAAPAHETREKVSSWRPQHVFLAGEAKSAKRNINVPVAVVRCRPHSDQSIIEHVLVALHHQLRIRERVKENIAADELGSQTGNAARVAARREAKCRTMRTNLMRSSNQIDVVVLVESSYYVTTEQIPCTTRTQAPTIYVLRVGPHEIAHGTVVRDLLPGIHAKRVRNWQNRATSSTA